MDAVSSMDNPVAPLGDAAESGKPLADIESLAQTVEKLAAKVAKLESGGGGQGQGQDVRSMLAKIGMAPTNWHQATVFFLTSKAEQDAEMRKKAPRMFACGVFMVLFQFLAAASICAGMLFPTCVDSNQCPRGQFCYAQPERKSGRCMFCGESPPLVPYYETTSEQTGLGPTNKEKMWNRISASSYPRTGLFRSSEPTLFGGFNDSHVRDVCARPFRPFRKYEVVTGPDKGLDGRDMIVSYSGEDVPPGIMPARGWSDDRGAEYSARSVGSWCDTCIHALTNDVSMWNEHALAQTSLVAMSLFDWSAMMMCSYVVGLSLVGEIKDTELCTIAASRGRNELSPGWKVALSALNRFRIHGFVTTVLVAVPMVILTRGGEALTVAFNTVAILFLTEVDNMTYSFGLGEMAKQRVDEAGHVELTDAEARKLLRTKVFCTTAAVVGIGIAVGFGSPYGTLVTGTAVVILTKSSEVLSMPESTPKEKLIFLGLTFGAQYCGFWAFVFVIIGAESGFG